MVSIERKRRLLPAIYNAAREMEQPIPSVAPIDRDNEATHENYDEGVSDSMSGPDESVSEGVENVSSEDVKPIVDAEDLAAYDDIFGDNHEAVNENDTSDSSEQQDSAASCSVLQESFMRSIRFESTRASNVPTNNAEPTKPNNEMGAVETNGDDLDEPIATQNQRDEVYGDVGALNDNTDESNVAEDGDMSDDERARKHQIEENLRKVLLYGETVVLDEELEFISIPEQELKAIQCEPKYRTKSNDQLCGNIPFKENVSF